MTELLIILGIIICIGFIIILYQIHSTKKHLISQQSLINEKNDTINTLIQSQTDTIHHLNDQNEKSLGNDERFDERLRSVTENLQSILKDSLTSSQNVRDIYNRVNALNDIMVNKKSRGNWGEYQLNNLLSVYAGDNQNIFETQYTLKNGYIGDVALHLPGEEKVMIIDSKFPLENYQNLLKENLGDLEVQKYESLFKQNIKKHINDIAKKYITSQTVENAVMFIPSEAIYMYVCANCSDMIEFAHKKHILITCPTTLIGVVFTLVNITKDFNRNKHIKSLEKDIVGMYEDAKRLTERLEGLDKTINKLQLSSKDVRTSAEKICGRVVKIHDGYEPEEENI